MMTSTPKSQTAGSFFASICPSAQPIQPTQRTKPRNIPNNLSNQILIYNSNVSVINEASSFAADIMSYFEPSSQRRKYFYPCLYLYLCENSISNVCKMYEFMTIADVYKKVCCVVC